MKESPLLLNSEMVKATLENIKISTRRPIKPQPPHNAAMVEYKGNIYEIEELRNKVSWFEEEAGDLWPCNIFDAIKCPYGRIGDSLYVRETIDINGYLDLYYKADNKAVMKDMPVNWYYRRPEFIGSIPSIHMPKWGARIWLEITNIHIERIQDITEEQAISEGIRFLYKDKCSGNDFYGTIPENFEVMAPNAYTAFMNLWNSLYKTWSDNPWVWAIEFKRIEK